MPADPSLRGPEDLGQDVQSDIAWLLQNQKSLDLRLERLESSIVFRILKAIGRKGFYRRPADDYTAWRKRSDLHSTKPANVTVIPAHENFASAVEQATTDFVSACPIGAQFHPSLSRCLANHPDADLLYTDEEELDETGSPLRPIFKPDWSPILLRSVDYIGNFTALRRQHANGFPDLRSAVLALLNPKVVHVPQILFGTHERRLNPAPVTKTPAASDELISILICTRSATLLATCLNALRARTDWPNLELVVVQHIGFSSGTEEASVEQVIARHGAKRVTYGKPFNFAEMNNLGAATVTGTKLVFLNDDVEPLDSTWLRRLSHWLDDPAIGAAGAKLLFPDGSLQHAGIAAWMTAGAWHPGRNVASSFYWPWNQYTREVSAATAACLAMRTADFHGLNGFDPRFPVNFNDVDLCFRLQQKGQSVIVDAEAQLRHSESRTRTKGSSYEERRLFFRKWSHRLQRPDPYYNPNLAQNTEEFLLT